MKLKNITFTALFAALMAICSQIQIPLPMIPINLALFAAHLTAILLGRKYGSLAIIVYICLGMVGIPVFAGFMGGVGVLFGKTGGYIIGYLFDVLVISSILHNKKPSFLNMIIAMLLGTIACYAFGTIWFMAITGLGLWTSLLYCVIPFLIGDVIKILLSAIVAQKIFKTSFAFIH